MSTRTKLIPGNWVGRLAAALTKFLSWTSTPAPIQLLPSGAWILPLTTLKAPVPVPVDKGDGAWSAEGWPLAPRVPRQLNRTKRTVIGIALFALLMKYS